MKFGVREICDCVFKAKSDVKIGNKIFKKGQPVLYIDTAKTSTVEGAATTVYAQGGKGNTRLIAWEGEKTLTFTVEDALISKEGLELLNGDIAKDDKIVIEPNKFADYYYVEAKSLMRKAVDGKDYLLTIVLPRVKIQSGFTMTMAPTGDPSTFSYVMDAFPGKVGTEEAVTADKTTNSLKKVLCEMTINSSSVSEE